MGNYSEYEPYVSPEQDRLWNTLYEDKVRMYKGKQITAQMITIGDY